jgi:DNA-directed RNA polymerase specialized sigma24 family protein
VSTRYGEKRAAGGGRSFADSSERCLRDPCEEVAFVAAAKRGLLLRVHRHRLRREDLEDCYSQATLELIAHAKAGGSFAGREHITNAIELRFVSRARDRRRALSGRSPIQAALEHAEMLGTTAGEGVELIDRGAEVDAKVIVREELRRLSRLVRLLSVDQRRVLASQVGGEPCAQFCSRNGWSREKYRKVAQRARTRLRELMREADVPSAAPRSEGHIGQTYDITPPT